MPWVTNPARERLRRSAVAALCEAEFRVRCALSATEEVVSRTTAEVQGTARGEQPLRACRSALAIQSEALGHLARARALAHEISTQEWVDEDEEDT